MGWLLLYLHLLLFHFISSSSSSSTSHFLCHLDHNSALLQLKTSFTIDTTEYACGECDETYMKIATWENGTDCCSWLGVTCDTISGHVIGLDLSCNGLQGMIHPNSTLFHLDHLQKLNLACNRLFPSQLSSQFGLFVNLTHLNLSSSNIQGEVSSSISHLSKLVSLDLSRNDDLKLSETTWKRLTQNATAMRELVLDHTNLSLIRPSSLSSLLNLSSSLVTLSLQSTGLRGNLTNDIICLPNLQELYLTNNFDLQGQLPKLSCSVSLNVLDLSGCQFQGTIPLFLSNLTHLTSLNLAKNNIGGGLPSLLSSLPNLVFLDFSENKFSGLIPYVFGGLTKLETLNLKDNNLGGQIPSSLFQLTSLSYLDCSSNKLEGPLPNKIASFSNLTKLLLNDNLLNGTIPSWCLSLPSLVDLDLSNNQFAGYISAISSYSLEYLYLCNNKLQGNIPESIFNLVNLTDLCLSSNNWSGPVKISLFSKLQNLESLSLSYNSQLSLDFESNVNYSFPHLKVLDLSSINLIDFPKSSRKFPSLMYIDLSNNKLNGKVPNWLLEMDMLQFVNLSQNSFTSMGQFSRIFYWLSYLDLSFNSLTGDISSSICNMSVLHILNLSHNKLTGRIPQCLANLSYLQVLDLQMNKLYGTLPSTFSNKELRTLNLNDNQLEGPLSESLSNCEKLEILNLGNNQIEDTFPHWLQTLPILKILVLRTNKLHGPIAGLKSKVSFPSLIIFDISCNNFSGPIPKAYIKNFKAMMKNVLRDDVDITLQYLKKSVNIATYTHYYESFYDSMTMTNKGHGIKFEKIPPNFVSIDMSENKFEGEIPFVIGELHALKGLNIFHNRLNGSIPQSMGNLANLESLDLSSNMLTGGIPTELTNLNFLAVLNLSENHLEGPIPHGKQFDTFLNDSYEGNLGLCGLPLSRKCNKDPDQHSPPPQTSEHEQKFGFSWKPVAIGYGCGMIFGVGLGCCVFLTGKPQWLVRMFGGQPNKRVKRRTRKRIHERMTQLVRMS